MAKSKAPLEIVPKPSIIQPIIRNHRLDPITKQQIPVPHEWEELFQDHPETMPVLKAVGYTKVSQLHNTYVSYTVTFQGDKVLSIQVDEPNLRQIAEESAKINFVTELSDKEDV